MIKKSKNYYWIKAAVILSLALILSGCISYTEDMVVNSDGSGVLSLNIGIDDSLLSLLDGDLEMDELIGAMEVADGLRLTDRTSYSDRGVTWLSATLEFDSLEQLVELGTGDEDGIPFIGEITLITDDDGNLSFERNLNLHDESQEMAFMFANTYWEFKIQFPSEILDANTADQNIDDETNTVTWIFSLASLMQRPQQMKATIAQPSNTSFGVYFAIGAIFLLAVVYVVIKRKKAPVRNV